MGPKAPPHFGLRPKAAPFVSDATRRAAALALARRDEAFWRAEREHIEGERAAAASAADVARGVVLYEEQPDGTIAI